MKKREPYHLNVFGDFYVEHGCCTSCGIPEHYAPALFGSDDDQCYVKKQPTSRDELALMVEIFATQDLSCVRYKGRDSGTLSNLERIGSEDECDQLPS